MRKIKFVILILLLAANAVVGTAFAKSTLDLSIAGVSARAMGMGRAYVGVLEGSEAVFLNPAGIASSKAWGVTSMSTKLLDRVDYKMLGGVCPTQYGVFGLGYVGTITPAGFLTTDKNSLAGAKAISYGSNMLVLSYARELGQGAFKNSSLGVNLKYFDNKFDGVDGSGSGIDADIAILASPSEKIKVGAVLQNFLPGDMGGSVNWKSGNKEGVPSVLKVGGSYLITPTLLLAADADMPFTGKSILLHSGVEWRPFPMVAIRGGLDQNPGIKDNVTDFSLGVGLNIKGIHFDYAYKNNSLVENSNAHYVSLSFAAEEFAKKEVKPLVEKNAKKTVPGEPQFASEKERNEYLYSVATGKIKPAAKTIEIKAVQKIKTEKQTTNKKSDKVALK